MITKTKLISCILAVITLLSVSDLFLPKGEAAIYDNTVRLHILANSDSEYDQQVKYAVRDAVIQNSSELKDITDTEILKARLEEIALSVDGVETVKTVFGEEFYQTKSYDGVMFPAGVYTSMQLVIGEGKGQNWWCVLFPPLCLSARTAQDALEGTGMDRDDVNVFTQANNVRYRFRFKILEFFGLFKRK